MNPVLRAAAVIGAAGAACVAYGAVVEANAYRLRRFDLELLPPGTGPVRMLHLADLHLLPRQRRRMAWVERLAALEPDLVIDTGDNLASAAALDPLMDALQGLLSRPGAFVLGSNDYYTPVLRSPLRYLAASSSGKPRREMDLPHEELVARLGEHGWHDLTHTRQSVELHGVRIELRGTDDAHLDRDDYA